MRRTSAARDARATDKTTIEVQAASREATTHSRAPCDWDCTPTAHKPTAAKTRIGVRYQNEGYQNEGSQELRGSTVAGGK